MRPPGSVFPRVSTCYGLPSFFLPACLFDWGGGVVVVYCNYTLYLSIPILFTVHNQPTAIILYYKLCISICGLSPVVSLSINDFLTSNNKVLISRYPIFSAKTRLIINPPLQDASAQMQYRICMCTSACHYCFSMPFCTGSGKVHGTAEELWLNGHRSWWVEQMSQY